MLNRKYKNVSVDTAFKVVKGAVTLAANAGTINAPAGRVTTGALVTASAGSQVLTITNQLVGPNDTIVIQPNSNGTNTNRGFVILPLAASGSFTATVYNTSASALNGTIIFDYVIIKG